MLQLQKEKKKMQWEIEKVILLWVVSIRFAAAFISELSSDSILLKPIVTKIYVCGI